MYSNQTASLRDPYNYSLHHPQTQNSFISKLPGHSGIPLHSYPEVALLFQAAEIERLNSMMDGDRLAKKGINKEGLDRHSYEIQIKELTQIIDTLRSENEPLKQHIHHMKIALESAEGRGNGDLSKLENKYERALLEIGRMYEDNTNLQEEVNQLKAELIKVKSSQPEPPLQNSTEETQALRIQISSLEAEHSEKILELHNSYQKEIKQYKVRMEEKRELISEEIEERLFNTETELQKVSEELRVRQEEKWTLETAVRKGDLKGRELEGKLRNVEFERDRLTEEIELLGNKITEMQSSACFASLSLSLPSNQVEQISTGSPHLRLSKSANASQEDLENGVALLSQEVERLLQVIKEREGEITDLKNKDGSDENVWVEERAAWVEKTKEWEKEKERYLKDISTLNGEVTQLTLQSESMNATLPSQLNHIKEQERSICEEVYRKSVFSYTQQLQENQEKFSQLYEKIEKQGENFRKCEVLLKDKEGEISKLERLLHGQAEKIREKEVQSVELLKLMEESRLKEGELESKVRKLEMKLMDKTNENMELEKKCENWPEMISSTQENNMKHYELLAKKLDYLGVEAVRTKNTILETISDTSTIRLTNSELTQISSTLEFLSRQILTLSSQIMSSFQTQIDFAASEIPEKIHRYNRPMIQSVEESAMSHSETQIQERENKVLTKIWNEIEMNSKWNREELERWRSTAEHLEREVLELRGELLSLRGEKGKWLDIERESYRIRDECKRIEQQMVSSQFEKQSQNNTNIEALIQSNSLEKNAFKNEIYNLTEELQDKTLAISHLTSKLQNSSEQQLKEVKRLMQEVEEKSEEIVELRKRFNFVKEEFEKMKEKFKNVESVVEIVLKSLEKFKNFDSQILEELNALGDNYEKAKYDLEIEKQDKLKIIEQSREQIKRLTEQITDYDLHLALPNNENTFSIPIGLKGELEKLSLTIRKLQKENYILTRQSYDGSTQDHIQKEFEQRKIHELRCEIERLLAMNMELREDLSRCRLQIVGEFSGEKRFCENLSTMVLLYAEIESLRSQIKERDLSIFST